MWLFLSSFGLNIGAVVFCFLGFFWFYFCFFSFVFFVGAAYLYFGVGFWLNLAVCGGFDLCLDVWRTFWPNLGVVQVLRDTRCLKPS